MIVALFRSRLNSGVEDEYVPMAQRLSELARAVPGYISHKGFEAAAGERVTIVEFETEEGLRAWGVDPQHRVAKKRGIEAFFSEYKVLLCSLIRQHAWAATDPGRRE